jgi:hypothetical protein
MLWSGKGMYQTRLVDQIIQARPVSTSEVFRFRFIRGKSHAHSRKIWRERRERHPWTEIKYTWLVPDMPELDAAAMERIRVGLAARIDRDLLGAFWGRP